MFPSWRKAISFLTFLLLSSLRSSCYGQSFDDELSDALGVVRKKFDSLDPKGKFAVGAASGFIVTRVIVGSAMTAIKVGAAAFITAEVLHHTGVLDVKEAIDDIESSDVVRKMKGTCANYASAFRRQVHKTFRPVTVQELFEKQRMAALGGASGCLAGLLL